VRLLVTGAGGQLGRDLVDAFSGSVPAGGLRSDRRTGLLGARLPWEVVGADHRDLDVVDRDAVMAALEGVRPDVVLHAAAWTAVDACEGDPDRAFAVNSFGTRNVVEAARRFGAHVVYISTDYVFDGSSPRPYHEWDPPCPMSVYGHSKLAGERELGAGATIVRTAWLSGAHGDNMLRTVLRLAAGDGPMRFVDDQRGSPTFTADLAGVVCTLATERLPGTFHVTNQGATTWHGFASAVVAASGGDPSRVEAIPTSELTPPRPASRPANSVLDNAALRLSGIGPMPDWQDGLGRLVAAVAGARRSTRAL